MDPKYWAMIAMACAALAGSGGQIMLKQANVQFDASIFTNWRLWAFGILYGTAVLVNIVAYRYGEASVLYPIISLSYIFTIVLASIFLNEALKTMKVIGGLTVLMGVAMIAFS